MGDFKPSRALLHPGWIASLVLLGLNDHVLKQAGILPPVVTGKLSDFAGLFVAPVVVAVVLRLRTRRATAIGYLAVGLGFTALQLSPGFARLVESMAPLRIWPDPTDLVALGALVVSFRVLVPVMEGGADSHAGLRGALAVVGLLICTGTSPARTFVYPVSEDWFSARVYLHNATGEAVRLDVRTLPDRRGSNCEALLAMPADYLAGRSLVRIGYWEIPAGQNVPLHPGEDDEPCHVIFFEGHAAVAWRPAELEPVDVPAVGRTPGVGEVLWNGEHFQAGAPVVMQEP